MSAPRNKSDKKIPPAELRSSLTEAIAGFRHAEVIVQQRLYNFLMTQSILLLAAAAILAANNIDLLRGIFLFTVSILGFLLSVAWAILGYRQRYFLELHLEIVEGLEQHIEDPRLRVAEPLAQLRAGKEVTFPVSKKEVQLPNLPRFMRSSNLLIAVPIAFAAVFSLLICAVLLICIR